MRKLLLFITALAVISAAFVLVACGGNAEEEKLTPIDVDIPYVGDFTCDYCTPEGTRRALLDILSSLPEKSECFGNTVTAHCTDGDLRFGNTYGGEVLIYLSEPVFVKN